MDQEQKVTPPKRSFNLTNFLKDSGIFLLQILIPALITGGVLIWLAITINFWKMERSLAISLFAILFIIISLILTVLLTDVVGNIRKKRSPRLRLVTMVVGGLIVPIAVFTAANLLFIAPGESYLTRLINLSLNQNVDVSMLQLGTAITSSHGPYTKIQGINAIQAIHSSQGLEQLFQVLNGDPTALTNWQVADVLSQAIASYGIDAKPGLMAAFQQHVKTTGATQLPTDLYNRYFAQSISSLQSEINSQPLDAATKQAQLQQVAGLASQLKTELNDIQSESLQASGIDPTLAFVMNTFLQMNITQDTDIYSLARTTASDATLPDSIRGQAIILMAKLGSQDDMTTFYQYVQGSDEIIKADALQAIANLTQKLMGATPTP